MWREKDLAPYVYGDLKREEPVRTGSVILHEHYFDNLGGDGRANGPALKLLTVDYGAVAAKYVEAFMQNVDWDEVNRRLEAVLGSRLA